MVISLPGKEKGDQSSGAGVAGRAPRVGPAIIPAPGAGSRVPREYAGGGAAELAPGAGYTSLNEVKSTRRRPRHHTSSIEPLSEREI